MNAVRRFLGLFQNSPTYGRDRANLISGFTIGTTALALNGAIMMMVLPLLLDPNDRDFRQLTENMEFGQLLGLILLGGATAFATLLIPLRLISVFMAPRVGRYFDQIVLSGITPLRFLIGKATSQNLFMLLIVFLLLPWFVLVLSLGGLEWSVFLGNLFLVWLYCMMLALLMLWLSLYLNEILAMLILVYVASVLCALGCAPLPFQPFVVTPFPALMHSVYAAVDVSGIEPTRSYLSMFTACAAAMSTVIGVALAAIYLGPLYGIIRDNSTFGEVVRAGDSKRTRRFRFRLHIQRPSEIAFFYENRGDAFRKHEGLIRWGTAMLCLLIVSSVAWALMISTFARSVPMQAAWGSSQQWWVPEFHVLCHTFHGIGLVLATFLFSHARNTTYQRLPILFGWKPEVSRLDTIGFLLFLLISTTTTISVPIGFDQIVAIPNGGSVFQWENASSRTNEAMDFARISREGTLVLSIAGLTVYCLQRTLCLSVWLKESALMLVAMFYLSVVCFLPLIIGMVAWEFPDFRSNPFVIGNAILLATMSPFTVLMSLYRELGTLFSDDLSTMPFYILHVILIAVCLMVMRRRSRKLRLEYISSPAQESA